MKQPPTTVRLPGGAIVLNHLPGGHDQESHGDRGSSGEEKSSGARAKPGERSQGKVDRRESRRVRDYVNAHNGDCYLNSVKGITMAVHGDGVRYVEGYGVPKVGGAAGPETAAFLHGWLEREDGTIIDATPIWQKQGADYFPAKRYTREEIRKHMRESGQFPIGATKSSRLASGTPPVFGVYHKSYSAAWEHATMSNRKYERKAERAKRSMRGGSEWAPEDPTPIKVRLGEPQNAFRVEHAKKHRIPAALKAFESPPVQLTPEDLK